MLLLSYSTSILRYFEPTQHRTYTTAYAYNVRSRSSNDFFDVTHWNKPYPNSPIGPMNEKKIGGQQFLQITFLIYSLNVKAKISLYVFYISILV